ncbi:hypothetical protein EV363DRAFT_1263874, partial [Boletus edulis]
MTQPLATHVAARSVAVSIRTPMVSDMGAAMPSPKSWNGWGLSCFQLLACPTVLNFKSIHSNVSFYPGCRSFLRTSLWGFVWQFLIGP